MESSPATPADTSLPFEEMLVHAVERGRAALDPVLRGWGEDARRSSERALSRALSTHLSPLLYREFDLFRRSRLGPLASRLVELVPGEARDLYDSFVDTVLLGGTGSDETDRHIARVTDRIIDQWSRALVDLVEQMRVDRSLLLQRFGLGGSLRDIEMSLSDRHAGGRSVSVLIFEQGGEVVHKPRPLAVEACFGGLLTRFEDAAPMSKLYRPTVVERKGYGWMEKVRSEPCTSREEVSRYFERAGCLLCLLYLLRGVDCHAENVVAFGEFPVLVDLEALVRPRLNLDADGGDGASDRARERLEATVLGTGLLPMWVGEPGSFELDIGGLSDISEQPVPTMIRQWSDVSRDAMRWRYTRGTTPPIRNNLPVYEGFGSAAVDFREEIVSGFSSMYRRVRRGIVELRLPHGFLRSFQSASTRIILRPSESYARLLERRLWGERVGELDDEEWFRQELSTLPPRFSAGQRAILLESEARSLGSGDVPRFSATAGGRTIWDDAGTQMGGIIDRSGLELVEDRLDRWDSENLEEQVALIRLSLSRREEEGRVRERPMVFAAGRFSRPPDEFLERALEIGRWLQRSAIHGPDGGVNWLAPRLIATRDRFTVDILGTDLYEGRTGVALFLAALYRCTDDASFAQLARGALDSTRASLSARGTAIGSGAASGWGGVVYAFAQVGHWLKDAEILDAANGYSASLVRSIEKEASPDVLGGMAGGALGLLAVREATGLDEADGALARIAHELVESSARFQAGGTSGESLPLWGFSHGAAGIAYTLAKLDRSNPTAASRMAIEDLLARERAEYDQERANWPDQRSPGAFAYGWCHGSPGIGLARAGVSALGTYPAARRDAVLALRSMRIWEERGGFVASDTLCCGRSGRIESFLAAGRRLRAREWESCGLELAARMVEDRDRVGGYRLDERLPHGWVRPGLFKGLAGVGYTFLRATDPSLDSVLLLEVGEGDRSAYAATDVRDKRDADIA